MIPPHIRIVGEDPQNAEDEYGEGYCEDCGRDGNECTCDIEDEYNPDLEDIIDFDPFNPQEPT